MASEPVAEDVNRLPHRSRDYRELLGWLLWTVLADWLIFRSEGIAGFALFLALVPLVFWLRADVGDESARRYSAVSLFG